MFRKVNNRYTNTKSGFGLVELLVSISIIVLVTSVVLARQSSFNGAILLRSQAYEIALQIRETQLYAVSAVGDGSANFRQLFGVYFDVSNDDEYVIFTDNNGNDRFDNGEEFGLQGFLDNRFEIREIREAGTSNTYNNLEIIFERPNFDARFFEAGSRENISGIEIEVSRRGSTGTGVEDVRVVEITGTGQISVI